jgi:hypothetical protein
MSSPQIARASFIFEHVGRGRGSVCATGHCFDAFFRSELTEGHTPGVTAKCQLRRALSHLWLVLRHDRNHHGWVFRAFSVICSTPASPAVAIDMMTTSPTAQPGAGASELSVGLSGLNEGQVVECEEVAKTKNIRTKFQSLTLILAEIMSSAGSANRPPRAPRPSPLNRELNSRRTIVLCSRCRYIGGYWRAGACPRAAHKTATYRNLRSPTGGADAIGWRKSNLTS